MRMLTAVLCAAALVAGAAATARAADKTDAKDIVAKAMRAMGGEEKLARYKSSTSKGKCKFYAMGRAIECTAEWWLQPPRQLKAVYHMDVAGKKMTRVEVITKDRGWFSMNGKTRALPPDQLAEIYEGMEAEKAANLLALKDSSYRLALLGESVVADRPVVGIKATRLGHRDVLLYFDKDKGYLVKMQTRVKGMTDGEVDLETFYADYHDYDGVQYANKTTTKRDGKLFLETDTTEFKPVEKLPDSTFEKP
jgi:hypothetical protein